MHASVILTPRRRPEGPSAGTFSEYRRSLASGFAAQRGGLVERAKELSGANLLLHVELKYHVVGVDNGLRQGVGRGNVNISTGEGHQTPVLGVELVTLGSGENLSDGSGVVENDIVLRVEQRQEGGLAHRSVAGGIGGQVILDVVGNVGGVGAEDIRHGRVTKVGYCTGVVTWLV